VKGFYLKEKSIITPKDGLPAGFIRQQDKPRRDLRRHSDILSIEAIEVIRNCTG